MRRTQTSSCCSLICFAFLNIRMQKRVFRMIPYGCRWSRAEKWLAGGHRVLFVVWCKPSPGLSIFLLPTCMGSSRAVERHRMKTGGSFQRSEFTNRSVISKKVMLVITALKHAQSWTPAEVSSIETQKRLLQCKEKDKTQKHTPITGLFEMPWYYGANEFRLAKIGMKPVSGLQSLDMLVPRLQTERNSLLFAISSYVSRRRSLIINNWNHCCRRGLHERYEGISWIRRFRRYFWTRWFVEGWKMRPTRSGHHHVLDHHQQTGPSYGQRLRE